MLNLPKTTPNRDLQERLAKSHDIANYLYENFKDSMSMSY